MQHLDLIALRYFSEAAETGSLRQAADRMHVTPSAVSRRINKLEHQLKTVLFERRASGVVPTAAGKILAAELHAVYGQLSRVQELIGDLDGQRRGNVTLYCMEGAVEGWASQVVEHYRRAYPQIRFHLRVSSTDQSIEALIRGECDIAIMFKAPRRAEITTIARGREPLMALVGPDHVLARKQAISLADLFQHEMVMPDARFGIRQLVDREARILGAALPLAITTNSIAMTRSLVRNGGLATILPYLSARHDCDLGLLKALAITQPDGLKADIELCVRKGRPMTASVKGMLAALEDSFERFVGSCGDDGRAW